MAQQTQLCAFCVITVALSLVATLVCLNEKGKVKEHLVILAAVASALR